MKITQEIRDYASQVQISADKAIERGLAEKAEEFVLKGGQINVVDDESKVQSNP